MNPGDIFHNAHSRPTGHTKEMNEVSLSFITVALTELFFLRGCKFKEIDHQTLIFGTHPHEFKSLSVKYEFTWRNRTFSAVMGCPYPEFLTNHEAGAFVRLYTTDPLEKKTIYASMPDILSFQPSEYIFLFLLNDFSWFGKNLDFIKQNIQKKEKLEKDDNIILDMENITLNMDTPYDVAIDETGKKISSILMKSIFSR